MAHPVAGAAAAGFLLLFAWGAPAPLDLSERGYETCAPAPRGGVILFGGPVVQPDRSLVLQDVRLRDPSGLSVLHAWVIPTTRGATGSSDVPPADFPPWASRVPAEGAVLTDAEEQQVLLEVARTTGGGGAAQGLVISYTARGHAYVTTAAFLYRLRGSCF